MKTLELTEKESKVLNAFIKLLYAEAGFSDAGAPEIAKETGFPINTVKGVVGSLVKKGVIEPDPNADDRRVDMMGRPLEAFNTLYLNEDYYSLHPEWKQDINLLNEDRTNHNVWLKENGYLNRTPSPMIEEEIKVVVK